MLLSEVTVIDPSVLNTVLELLVAISLLSVRHKKRKVSGTLDIPGVPEILILLRVSHYRSNVPSDIV